MTEQQPGDPEIIVSPALSLRQAVRPATVAYAILARQQARAAALAEQAEQLVAATRSFLQGAGLAHLLGPAPTAEVPNTDVTDKQAGLRAAYANAGMQWVRVMTAVAALEEALIADGEWENVQRLTAALDDIGETKAA